MIISLPSHLNESISPPMKITAEMINTVRELLASQLPSAVPAVRLISKGNVSGRWQGQAIRATAPAIYPLIVCQVLISYTPLVTHATNNIP
jgi:hypothetical protein